LDAEIAALCRFFPKDVGLVWKAGLRANAPEIGRVECHTNLGTGGPHYSAPRFTASLDAAMKLVPETTDTKLGRLWCVERFSEITDGKTTWKGKAVTEALALCAASLRARSLPGEGGSLP